MSVSKNNEFIEFGNKCGKTTLYDELSNGVEIMIPKRLKDAREEAGLSQEKLAQLTDIETVNNRSRISNYEAGRYSPPFEFVRKVADLLGYPEAYFYTVDDDFADLILRLHRDKNDPNLNPYYGKLREVKELAFKLNECLKDVKG